MIEFIILGDPVGKLRHRMTSIGGKARAYKHKRQKAWEEDAAKAMRIQYDGPTLEGPLFLVVLSVFKRPQRLSRRKDPSGLVWKDTRPDVDNLAKSVCDAMQIGGILRDDGQIVCVASLSAYAAKPGFSDTVYEPHTYALITHDRVEFMANFAALSECIKQPT